MKKYELENLNCAHCASEIEKGVKNLSCVRDAKVVFATKTLVVDTDDIDTVRETISSIDNDVKLKNNDSDTKKYILKNLDCANCAMEIEKELNKQSFVEYAKVVFPTKTLIIKTDNINEVRKVISSVESDVTLEVDVKEKIGSNFNVRNEILKLVGIFVLFLVGLFSLNYSESLQEGAKVAFASPDILRYISLGVLIVVYVLSGKNVLVASYKNILKGKIFDENFLMTFATIAAWIIGEHAEAVGVMLFYKAGEFVQDLAVNKSRRSINSLMDIRPDYAVVLRNGEEVRVSPDEVEIGEIVVCKPGEKVPLDGEIVKGHSAIDTRALTGESVPRNMGVSEKIMAGVINLSGLIEIKVEKSFKESSVSKILDLVENAAANKAKTETFISKFAAYYTPAVFFVALGIATLPPLFGAGEFSDWIYRALVALVVSCPCALIISVPLGYFGGIGGASKKGILIKGANYLEALANVKAVGLDKTGTITKGVFTVTEIVPDNGFSKDEVLKYAAIAESKSSHPIATSIVEYAKISDFNIVDYEVLSGMGIKAVTDEKTVLVGNDRLLHFLNIEHQKAVCNVPGSVAHVVIDNKYAGYIIVSDELKDDSVEAIKKLHANGVEEIIVLTGDNQYGADSILKDTGVDNYYYDLLPEDKTKKFKEFTDKYKDKGASIFVGDGINDAPALALADVGVSMGVTGSDAAIETADVVIMNDSLDKLNDAISVAKKTRVIIWQNIIFALGVKVAFILAGLLGYATMWEAVIGDVGVSLVALLNAMRVLR